MGGSCVDGRGSRRPTERRRRRERAFERWYFRTKRIEERRRAPDRPWEGGDGTTYMWTRTKHARTPTEEFYARLLKIPEERVRRLREPSSRDSLLVKGTSALYSVATCSVRGGKRMREIEGGEKGMRERAENNHRADSIGLRWTRERISMRRWETSTGEKLARPRGPLVESTAVAATGERDVERGWTRTRMISRWIISISLPDTCSKERSCRASPKTGPRFTVRRAQRRVETTGV